MGWMSSLINPKICVVTGSRAEYGLLKLLMKHIKDDSELSLQIIVTGMHLSSLFGLTFREIERDGFEIDRKVECLSPSDSPTDIAQAVGKVLFGCTEAFHTLKPDLVVVLGDRFEIFAAATAALISRIPIAHLHGGEVTTGAYDDAFRHSITKMSSMHFVATDEYSKRVIQMGEHPERVHVVGGLGVDAIKSLKLLNRFEIEKLLGFKFGNKSLLVTLHSATLEEQSPSDQISELLEALSDMADTTLIFTMPNADSGGHVIIDMVLDFVKVHKNAFAFNSLGQLLYVSCMAQVNGVVGNSSSGLLEAPTLKVGTVNIGTRQNGRTQSMSIINCPSRASEIKGAIEKLFSSEFQKNLGTCINPYGNGGASQEILRVLKSSDLSVIKQKYFYGL
jgi:GDP/UDP-N,N'-diacetylbacillosamine 2-epimerase (hydrolysing)